MENMINLLHLLCLMAAIVNTGDCQCRAAEEGTAYNITGCTFTPTNTTINYTELRWMAVINNTATLISSCDPNGICNNSYPGFTADLDNNKSYMTIENVSRLEQGLQFNVETTWSCQWSPLPSVNICIPLRVYAKPKNVKCDIQALKVSKTQYTCTAEQVYPPLFCNLYSSPDNVSYAILRPGYSENNITSSEGMPIYYRTTCTFFNMGGFYIGTTYLRASLSGFIALATGCPVYSDVYQITLVVDHEDTTTQEVTTQLLTTQKVNTESVTANHITNREPDSSIVIGLGVASATLVCVVIVLIVATVFWCKRHKQKERQEKMKRASHLDPENHCRIQHFNQNEGRHVNNPPGGRSEPDNFLNLTEVYANMEPPGWSRAPSYMSLAYPRAGVSAAQDYDSPVYEN